MMNTTDIKPNKRYWLDAVCVTVLEITGRGRGRSVRMNLPVRFDWRDKWILDLSGTYTMPLSKFAARVKPVEEAQ